MAPKILLIGAAKKKALERTGMRADAQNIGKRPIKIKFIIFQLKLANQKLAGSYVECGKQCNSR